MENNNYIHILSTIFWILISLTTLSSQRKSSNLKIENLHPSIKKLPHQMKDEILLKSIYETSEQQLDACLNDPNLNLNALNKTGYPPLHLAIIKQFYIGVHKLLKAGADINIKNEKGETALHVAAKLGDKESVRYLIFKRANIDCVNKKNETTLHYAVKYQYPEIVKILLEAGATPTVTDIAGQTPLHLAVICQDEEILNLLLEKKINVNVQDSSGFSPLHIAMEIGNPKIAQLLIEKGADFYLLDHQKEMPYQKALKWQHQDALRYAKVKCLQHYKKLFSKNFSHSENNINDFQENGKIQWNKVIGACINLFLKNKPLTQKRQKLLFLILEKMIIDKASVQLFEWLYNNLENNNEPKINDLSEENLLFTAIKNHNLEITKYLLEKQSFNHHTHPFITKATTILKYAININADEITHYLLTKQWLDLIEAEEFRPILKLILEKNY